MDFLSRIEFLLNEKTFNINKDVDLLYKLGFKKWVDLLKKDIDKFFNEINKHRDSVGYYVTWKGDSGILTSKQCKLAHSINPVEIHSGAIRGNFYVPKNKLILLSMNPAVIKLLERDRAKAIDSLPDNQKVFFRNEITETNIKGSIYHELSHWLNDTLHNNAVSRNMPITQDKIDKLWSGDVNLSDFEIDAQVHAIKQIKRNYKKDFDKLTWVELSQIKTSFWATLSTLHKFPKDVQIKYFKTISKRLNREGLLGKGLTTSFFSAVETLR